MRPTQENRELFANMIDGYTGEPIPLVRTIEMDDFKYVLDSEGNPCENLFDASKGSIFLFWKELGRLEYVIDSELKLEVRKEPPQIVNVFAWVEQLKESANGYNHKIEKQKKSMNLLISHLGLDKDSPRTNPVAVPIKEFMGRVLKKKQQIPKDVSIEQLIIELQRMNDSGDYFYERFRKMNEKNEPTISIFRIVNYIFGINETSEDGDFSEIIRERYRHLESRVNRLALNLQKIAEMLYQVNQIPVKSSTKTTCFPEDISVYNRFKKLEELKRDILSLSYEKRTASSQSDFDPQEQATKEKKLVCCFYQEKEDFMKMVHENDQKIASAFKQIVTNEMNKTGETSSSSSQQQQQAGGPDPGFLKATRKIDKEVVTIERLYDCVSFLFRLPHLIRSFEHEIHVRNEIRNLFYEIESQLNEFKSNERKHANNDNIILPSTNHHHQSHTNTNQNNKEFDRYCQDLMMEVMNMNLVIRRAQPRKQEVVDVMKKYYRGIRSLEASKMIDSDDLTIRSSITSSTSSSTTLLSPLTPVTPFTNSAYLDYPNGEDDGHDQEEEESREQMKMLMKETYEAIKKSREKKKNVGKESSHHLESIMDNVLEKSSHLTSIQQQQQNDEKVNFEVPEIPQPGVNMVSDNQNNDEILKREIERLRFEKEECIRQLDHQKKLLQSITRSEQQQQSSTSSSGKDNSKSLVVEFPEQGDTIGFERINVQIWKMISPFQLTQHIYLSRNCVQKVLKMSKNARSIKVVVQRIRKVNPGIEDPLHLKRWKKMYFVVEGRQIQVCETKEQW